jgi:NurA-like 5'-3' nuclease
MSDKKILESNGWVIECESPFEIRHEDGSFASGQGALSVLYTLKPKIKNSNECDDCGSRNAKPWQWNWGRGNEIDYANLCSTCANNRAYDNL